MDDDETNLHLSQIETRWTLVFQAHRDQPEASHEAQEVLTRRYGGAVHRYLLRITRDPEAAADLAQDFALRMVRGDFRRADPSRGRFRDFIKTSIQNLVIDHHRRRRTQPQSMPASGVEIASDGAELTDLDEKFLACWREELLNHAWDGLQEHQEHTGRPLFLVLRYRADHPEMRSHEMAQHLSPRLRQPVNASWVRQTLLRARKKFVDLLVDEVSRSLGHPTPEQVEEELMNIGLWDFCRPTTRLNAAPADGAPPLGATPG